MEGNPLQCQGDSYDEPEDLLKMGGGKHFVSSGPPQIFFQPDILCCFAVALALNTLMDGNIAASLFADVDQCGNRPGHAGCDRSTEPIAILEAGQFTSQHALELGFI